MSTGWGRWTRKKYWGFDSNALPLNARVWYPDGPGPFPLAVIVHGNHNMVEFSDPGYAYLGELLASRGFIVASVDENFLNDGLFDDAPEPQAVRGWLLLEHLKLWHEWNQTADNPFHHLVDLSRIALMGHSRGGEAAATAAVLNRMKFYPDDASIRFDYQFAIKAVVAIAPADGQYKPAGQHRWLEDVSYLTLQGAHDADVSSFRGSRQWDHVRYTRAGPWFKAEIYAYRANHGQFNTVWGRTDTERPLGWLLNLKPLMPGEEQRRISKTYIAAFLEATLRDRREYLPLFQDWRAARLWLPDTLYVNRYQDASYVPLATFDEDADVTTTTAPGGHMAGENLSIWREGRIPWRQGDRDYNGVFLGWNRAEGAAVPTYAISLPEGAAAKWNLGSDSTIELSIAALDQEAPRPARGRMRRTGSRRPRRQESGIPGLHARAGGKRRGGCVGAGDPLRGNPAPAEGEVHEARCAGPPEVREGLGAGVPDGAGAPDGVSERRRRHAIRPAQADHGEADIRSHRHGRDLRQRDRVRKAVSQRHVTGRRRLRPPAGMRRSRVWRRGRRSLIPYVLTRPELCQAAFEFPAGPRRGIRCRFHLE